MPAFCSCGAELPPDARFCHKCGKPQWDEPLASEETAAGVPAGPPEPAAAPQPPALNFHNPIAVRIGLSMASAAALLSSLPLLSMGSVIWWGSAGFFSVYLYRRRTGQPLNIRSGVRMGWITGVLTFAIMTVLLTIAMIPAATSSGGLLATYQEQLRNLPSQYPNVEQVRQFLMSPAGMAMFILFTLLLSFFMIISFCTAGGALGAKIVGRD